MAVGVTSDGIGVCNSTAEDGSKREDGYGVNKVG